MNSELTYLVLVSTLTAFVWVPYLIDRVWVRGLFDTVGYPAHPREQSAWAQRMKKAHTNAVENLVVFTALVLALQFANISNQVTMLACAVYFWARVAHLVVYTIGIPWVRTLAFVTGFCAQVVLAWQFL